MESFILLETILFLVNCSVVLYFIKRQNPEAFEQTQSKLTFAISPKISQLIGMFFGGLGLIFLLFPWVITPITQLKCSHSYIQETSLTTLCKLIEIDWFGNEKSKKVFSGLRGVELETKTDTNSDGKIYYKYQILLLTDTESIPFRSFDYSKYDLEQFQSVISSIKSFLVNPLEKSLEFQEDDRQQGYISVAISLLLDFLALSSIASGLSITCTFDKEANRMILSRSRWFGILGKTVFLHSLDEVVDVSVETLDTDEGWVYRVIFVLRMGDILPLTRIYSSGYQHKQHIAKLVKLFLNSIERHPEKNLLL
ncbi:hypothetical protein WA1_06290 [Scytonema hofmannii PCC 7110]|uniref:Uncharacterized protein n=1 Tax=Scytonema hofmannii PCC 7110 TaxID=128403 RepID=A0A139WSM1_9CYAN|nr:hypothetical protein [Scytonema hofmannii]KYC35432.1 hypothetical protein WA1_06290 [Scytonema hofmannii PCC 7110]